MKRREFITLLDVAARVLEALTTRAAVEHPKVRVLN